MILVDTSVLIGFFRGDENSSVNEFREICSKHIPFGISSVIYQEVLQGAKNEKEFHALQGYLITQRFFNPTGGVESFTAAAEIYFKCRRKGLTIRSTIDCLIAQTVLEHDLFLLHNDKDFTAISSVIGLPIYRGSYGLCEFSG